MGILSSTKFIKNNVGQLQEQTALTTSAGPTDAQFIPALNANGILDLTITNGKVISAGTADSGKLVALDASGRIDSSTLPVGVGADVNSVVASEALAAGAFVNIWSNAGVFNVRNADATVAGKEAHGFVLSSFASAAVATVYFIGSNTALSGKTPGVQFLSTTAGTVSSIAPSGSGNVVQRVGLAVAATVVNFNPCDPIVLA